METLHCAILLSKLNHCTASSCYQYEKYARNYEPFKEPSGAVVGVTEDIMGDNFNVLLKAFKDALDFSENNFLSFAQCHKWRGRGSKWWEMVTWDKEGLKIMIIVGENFLNNPINIKDIYIYIYIYIYI